MKWELFKGLQVLCTMYISYVVITSRHYGVLARPAQLNSLRPMVRYQIAQPQDGSEHLFW